MSPEDEGFVDRLRAAYTPPPMSSFDEARFDARLRSRIEAGGRRRRYGLGALATAAAAAVLALATLPSTGPGEATPAVDWLAALEAPEATWVGEAVVVPADPLALPALDDGAALAALAVGDGDAADAADDGDATDEADEGPAWMPAEYAMLAQLIEVEPYAFEEEDWP